MFCTPLVFQEVCNYRLQWLLGWQFNFAQCFIKHWVLWEFSYLRVIIYTSLAFLHAYPWELPKDESKPTAFQVHCIHKVLHYLICSGGSSILFDSMRGWDWTLCEPGFNPYFNSHSCLTQWCSSAWLPQRHWKQGYFVYSAGNPRTSSTT